MFGKISINIHQVDIVNLLNITLHIYTLLVVCHKHIANVPYYHTNLKLKYISLYLNALDFYKYLHEGSYTLFTGSKSQYCSLMQNNSRDYIKYGGFYNEIGARRGFEACASKTTLSQYHRVRRIYIQYSLHTI